MLAQPLGLGAAARAPVGGSHLVPLRRVRGLVAHVGRDRIAPVRRARPRARAAAPAPPPRPPAPAPGAAAAALAATAAPRDRRRLGRRVAPDAAPVAPDHLPQVHPVVVAAEDDAWTPAWWHHSRRLACSCSYWTQRGVFARAPFRAGSGASCQNHVPARSWAEPDDDRSAGLCFASLAIVGPAHWRSRTRAAPAGTRGALRHAAPAGSLSLYNVASAPVVGAWPGALRRAADRINEQRTRRSAMAC